MSPNVGNFVHDLVEMAKAMETLPQVEAERNKLAAELESALSRVQARELAIIDYKNDIALLNDRIRSLEVERDDASFRVLEAEDREHVALNMARSIASAVGNVINTLDPPKPEPEKEPEPQAQPVVTSTEAPSQSYEDAHPKAYEPLPDTVHSIQDTTSGQSESSPTVETGSPQNSVLFSHATNTDAGSTTTETSSGEPTHGPYYGKSYFDFPGYISFPEWLEGGGTSESYNWRPEAQARY